MCFTVLVHPASRASHSVSKNRRWVAVKTGEKNERKGRNTCSCICTSAVYVSRFRKGRDHRHSVSSTICHFDYSASHGCFSAGEREKREVHGLVAKVCLFANDDGGGGSSSVSP